MKTVCRCWIFSSTGCLAGTGRSRALTFFGITILAPVISPNVCFYFHWAPKDKLGSNWFPGTLLQITTHASFVDETAEISKIHSLKSIKKNVSWGNGFNCHVLCWFFLVFFNMRYSRAFCFCLHWLLACSWILGNCASDGSIWLVGCWLVGENIPGNFMQHWVEHWSQSLITYISRGKQMNKNADFWDVSECKWNCVCFENSLGRILHFISKCKKHKESLGR